LGRPFHAATEPKDDGNPSTLVVMNTVSRRRLLLGLGGLGLAVAGAGAGAGVGASWHIHRPPPPVAPPRLVAALAREMALIAAIDDVQVHAGAAGLLSALRTDHAAHAKALQALLSSYPPAQPTPGPTSASTSAPGGSRLTSAQLRRAEVVAAAAATQDSAESVGALAVLFASIAACESGHVALLT
jgi:hypothetical protein